MSGAERRRRATRRAAILPDAHEPPGALTGNERLSRARAVASNATRASAPSRDGAETGAAVASSGNGPEADALGALARLGEMARVLGLALGFSPGALAAAEAFDAIEGESSLPIDATNTLADETLREAFARFGADLEIDLTLVGLDPTFDPVATTLRAADDPLRALDSFRSAADEVAATQGDSVSIDVRLRIAKMVAHGLGERIVAARAPKGAAPQAPLACQVFYTQDALRRLLTLRAAPLWRARGLGGEKHRLLIALCEGAGYLAGVALEIIGAAGPPPDAWFSLSPQAWRRFRLRMARALSLRASESAWSGVDLPLAPDHLRVVARAPGLEELGERLAALRSAVALCSLASVLDGDTQPATLRFAGTRPATLRLDLSVAPPALTSADARIPAISAPIAPSEPSEPESETDAIPDPLIALADWAYRDASPDRLAIARDALGRELPVATETSLEAVRAVATDALSAARANLTLYLRGAAERYFQLRGAALAAINDYATATRKAVSDLTGDVVDNLFKTVGLIAGVVIAGLIAPSASRPVAAFACLLYIAYVVFIIWYLLRARHARYELERRGLMTTLNAMSELTPEERRRLRAPAVQASNHFERYYRLTFWIYVGLAIAGAVVFLLILTPAWSLVAPGAHTAVATATP